MLARKAIGYKSGHIDITKYTGQVIGMEQMDSRTDRHVLDRILQPATVGLTQETGDLGPFGLCMPFQVSI